MKKGRNKRNKAIQESLDTLFEHAEPVVVPPAKPFAASLHEAASWTVPTMVRYLQEVIELPKYENIFLRHEINGCRFIGMCEDDFNRLELGSSLHKTKLRHHMELLRTASLSHANDHKPKSLSKWNSAHVAGWLTYEKNCENCGQRVLSKQLRLEDLAKANNLNEIFQGIDEKEVEKAVEVIGLVISLLPIPEKTAPPSQPQQPQQQPPPVVSAVPTKVSPAPVDNVSIPKQVTESSPQVVDTTRASKVAKKELTVTFAGQGDSVEAAEAVEAVEGKENVSRENQNLSLPSKPSAASNVIPSLAPEKKTGSNQNAAVSASRPGSAQPTPSKRLQKSDSQETQEFSDSSAFVAANKTFVEALSELRHSSLDKDNAISHLGTNFNEMERGLAKKLSQIEQKLSEESKRQEKMLVGLLEADRRGFVEKIGSLRDVTETHSKSVRELRELTAALRQDLKASVEASVHKTEQQSAETHILLAEMMKDRAVVMQSLALSTQSHVTSMKDEISGLTQELKQLLAEKRAQDTTSQHPPSLFKITPSTAEAAVRTSSAEPVKEMADFLGGQSGPGTIKGEAETVIHNEKIVSARESASEIQIPLPASAVEVARVEKTESDVRMRSFTVHPPSNGANMKNGLKLVEDTDFNKIISEDGERVVRVWKEVIQTYQVVDSSEADLLQKEDDNVRDSYSDDTRMLLTKAATRWVRLGSRLVGDSQLDSETKSQDPRELDIWETVKGIVACARNSLSAASSCIKESLDKESSKTISASLAKLGQKRSPDSCSRINPLTSRLSKQSIPPEDVRRIDALASIDAVGISAVFILGIMKKVLKKSDSANPKSQTSSILSASNLSFIHEQLLSGQLPFSELSRDDVRDLMETALKLRFSSWDKFDAICQRFDPLKKGFVGCENVIFAFDGLALVSTIDDPLASSTDLSKKGSPAETSAEAQLGFVLVLQLVIQELVEITKAKRNADVNLVLLDVIVSKSQLRESFDALQDKSHARQERLQSSRALAESNFMTKLLVCLIEPTLDRLSGQSKRSNTAGLFPMVASANSHPQRIWPATQPNRGAQHEKFEFDGNVHRCIGMISGNPEEYCRRVSRSLQIYDKRDQSLLAAFSSIVVTMSLLRRHSLEELQRSYAALLERKTGDSIIGREFETLANEIVKAGYTSHGTPFQETAEEVLVSSEKDILALLGIEKADEAIRRSVAMGLERLSRMTCEILGLPVPHGGIPGFLCSVLQAEIFIHEARSRANLNQDRKVRLDLEGSSERKHELIPGPVSVVITSSDNELDRSKDNEVAEQPLYERNMEQLLRDLEGSRAEVASKTTGQPQNGATVEYISRKPAIPETSLARDSNETIYRQYVQEVDEYLERLTNTALMQQKRHAALVNLWNASVSLVTNSNFGTKLKQLGPVEIMMRARDLEHALKLDRYAPADSRNAQMAKSVRNLEKHLSHGQIKDPQGLLKELLSKVNAVAEHSERTIDDALELSQKLIKKCKFLAN